MSTSVFGRLGILLMAGSLAWATPMVNAAVEAEKHSGSKQTDGAPQVKKNRGKPPTLAWVNPDVPAKAALLCVHGLGLHSQSYEDFGKRMSALGVPTYAVDVRGFGSWMNSPDQKEVDFEDCLQDVHDTLKVLRRVHPGLPIFILGESMGGAIALRATAMYPELIDGLISCVPSGDRFQQGKTELKVALRMLGGYNKQFDIGSQIVKQAASSRSAGGTENKQLQENWLRSDGLNRLKLSPKELIQFQKFMNANHEYAAKIGNTPVLMLQGDDDNLVNPQGTLELLHNIPVTNKEVYLVVIRDAKHLIFEEAQSNDQTLNKKVLKMVNTWIDDHLKKPEITQAAQSP